MYGALDSSLSSVLWWWCDGHDGHDDDNGDGGEDSDFDDYSDCDHGDDSWREIVFAWEIGYTQKIRDVCLCAYDWKEYLKHSWK